MTTRDLALNGRTGELALATPIEAFRPLDVYAGGYADEAPRLEALATISAGYRDPQTRLPQRSTDGRIHLHKGTTPVPGLEAALEAGGWRRLTIAFPFDDPSVFVQQRFMAYSQTALLAYGDAAGVWTIKDRGDKDAPSRAYWKAGTEQYRQVLEQCKVSVSVYFHLAHWTPEGPEMVMPDGMGFYRLRFTSRNSLRAILAQLRYMARFTGGRIAGIPFDLALDYREVADPRGKKRTIPVWTIVPRPPDQVLRLSSRNFRSVITDALEQGRMLQLPPPAPEDLDLELGSPVRLWEDEARPEEIVDPTDDELETMRDGGPIDQTHYVARWHALVRGTRWSDERERAKFILAFTSGRTGSLAEFVRSARADDAEALMAAIADAIETTHAPPQRPAIGITPEIAERQRQWEEQAAAAVELDRQRRAERLERPARTDYPLTHGEGDGGRDTEPEGWQPSVEPEPEPEAQPQVIEGEARVVEPEPTEPQETAAAKRARMRDEWMAAWHRAKDLGVALEAIEGKISNQALEQRIAEARALLDAATAGGPPDPAEIFAGPVAEEPTEFQRDLYDFLLEALTTVATSEQGRKAVDNARAKLAQLTLDQREYLRQQCDELEARISRAVAAAGAN